MTNQQSPAPSSPKYVIIAIIVIFIVILVLIYFVYSKVNVANAAIETLSRTSQAQQNIITTLTNDIKVRDDKLIKLTEDVSNASTAIAVAKADIKALKKLRQSQVGLPEQPVCNGPECEFKAKRSIRPDTSATIRDIDDE